MDNKMLKAFALLAKDRAYQSGVESAHDWAERALRIADAHMAFANNDEIVACAAILTARLEPVTHVPPVTPVTPSYYTTANLPGTAATTHQITPILDARNVPRCSENCQQFDGKRCALLGHPPESICEPSVREMAKALAKKP